MFANLELESAVQVNDKTRLNASKSFVPTGDDPITAVTITPGANGTGIDVFNSDQRQWYLDWQFSAFEADIDASNNKIDFTDQGVVKVATLTSGTYSLSALATEIQTQLNAASAITYSVSVDSDDKLTISTTESFSLLPLGSNKLVSALPMLGFKKEVSGSNITGKRIEWVTKQVSLELDDSTVTETRLFYIKLFSEAGDALYSSDSDLTAHEPDILRYTLDGRNSFLDVHRRAQDSILKWLDRRGYVDLFDERFTKETLLDREEVVDWSRFIALRLIFQGLSNATDDVFMRKAEKYEVMEIDARNRAVLRGDFNRDGEITADESVSISSGDLFRR